MEIFSEVLDKFCKRGNPIITSGDFNLNLHEIIHNDNGLVSDFVDIMASYGFIPVITRATHFQDNTATVIDNIFVNNFFSNITKSGVILTDLSDHFPTFLSIHLEKVSVNNTPLYRTVRPMPLEKKQAFCQALTNFNWHDILNKTEVDSAVDSFLHVFFGLFDFHFPKKVLKKNKKKYVLNNNFMTSDLLKLSHIKVELRKLKTREPTPIHIQVYKSYRNNYKKELKKAKELYFGRKIFGAGNDTRLVWDTLREASNISKKKKEIGDLIINGNIVSNDKEKANIFAEIFSNVGQNSIKDLPPHQRALQITCHPEQTGIFS